MQFKTLAVFTASFLAALAQASTSLAAVGVSGTLLYKDYDSNGQPARRVTIKVFAADGVTLLDTVRTDNTGAWSSGVPSATGYVIKAQPINDGASVADGANPVYTVAAGTAPAAGGAIAAVTLDAKAGTNAERSFAVADALQTSWLYATAVRGATPVLQANFGNVNNAGASNFDGTKINITQRRRFAWDVLNHEYGHYLASLDTLDQNPGDTHSFGVSNIPAAPTAAQKLNGVRLAWGEGLASYTGIASQAVAAHPNSSTIGNTAYESFDADLTPNQLFGVDLENAATPVAGVTTAAVGEGDELTTARVCWDLADSTNETHDRISMGHTALYGLLKSKHYDQLGALWTGLTTAAANDAARTDIGGIFQLDGASPTPDGAIAGSTISSDDIAPTFDWTKGNDGANDKFGLIVWDAAFSTRILDLTSLGNVTSYTLSAGQWDFLRNYQGVANFVITGSDTDGFATPSYWSDAYSFTIVQAPEPAAIGAIAIGGLTMLRRRRRAA